MKGRELLINGNIAYSAWGIVTDDSFLSALLTPPPMKDYIVNISRAEGGSRVVKDRDLMLYDAREITLPFSMVASSEDDFWIKYNSFCSEVLSKGEIVFEMEGVVYNTVYLSCTQFSEYRRGMAKFTLKVCEYNPNVRTKEEGAED